MCQHLLKYEYFSGIARGKPIQDRSTCSSINAKLPHCRQFYKIVLKAFYIIKIVPKINDSLKNIT